MKIFSALSIAVLLTGCTTPRINKVEYYEPTEANKTYCTQTKDNVPGHGPIKSLQSHKGLTNLSLDHLADFRVSVF